MSVDPRRGHQKKQWWKKNSRRTGSKRNRTFNNKPNTETVSTVTTEPLHMPQTNNITTFINENSGDILVTDPETLTPRQIRTLQTELGRVIKLNHQLEMELNLRASQVEQMEDNFHLVADQSKMIGVRAMEQEQKLLEIKKALELKTKQLALFRGSKADQLPLNAITVLPMHLRGKFSEFLRGILLSQKKFFESALRDFVANQITDKELTLNAEPLTRHNLLLEIGKIGNSLAFDYMSELELRLNGTFSPQQDTTYTLVTLHSQHASADTQASQKSFISQPATAYPQTPQHTPNPPPHMNMMTNSQRPGSPNFNAQQHKSQHTFSSQGPPMISMNAPSHTPAHSYGSSVGMTPQTSVSVQESDNQNRKRGNSAFDKVKKLLPSKKRKKQQLQQQQLQQQQQQQMQMQPQQMQYPPPAPQQFVQQQSFHQYPAQQQFMNGQNGHTKFPPAPSMSSIPSNDQTQTAPTTFERAANAYNFHTSSTSTHNSAGAMDVLMHEIAAAEANMNMNAMNGTRLGQGQSVSTGSSSVIIKGDVNDEEEGSKSMHTDIDYSSDEGDGDRDDDDKKMNNMNDMMHDMPPLHPRVMSNNSESTDDDDDQFVGNADAMAMQQQLLSMTQKHTQAILTKHGADGSNELNKMWSQFVQFKKGMDRPSDAPLAFTVPDKTQQFVELRDLLEALPFDLSCAILREQRMNPTDRIKDVTIQRGCWPMVRYVRHNRVQTINQVFLRFDDVLSRLEMYLKNEKESSDYTQISMLSKEHLEMMNGNGTGVSTRKPAGNQLLGSLDPQKTTGFRLHQITSVIRQRNEARDTITALNLRVGRLWNMDISMEKQMDLITDSIDFFQSLDNPSTMLLLGPNTSEKCALCRELCKQLSSSPINMRTALVDTRSTVGGFTKSPIETGQAVRFYVNSVGNQHNQINATRSIYPQVVVVDEVLSLSDIESIGKLQSEGISVVVGTNMHSLEALLGHPLYSQLLPPQDRLLEHGVSLNTMSGSMHQRRPSYQYSSMSPHLLILEMNADGTTVKMFKNIPAAVKAIKRFSQPEFKSYQLKWQGYNPADNQHASKYMNNQLHKRTTSRMVNKLMKDTLSYKSSLP